MLAVEQGLPVEHGFDEAVYCRRVGAGMAGFDQHALAKSAEGALSMLSTPLIAEAG